MVCRHVVRALAVAVIVSPVLSGAVAGQAPGIREVSASSRSLIPLHTRIRYTTMIVLPDDEEILDVICGDKDFWVITATHNIAHVKPAKEGVNTNLNLVTDGGAVYSFLLSEKNGPGTPDLKIYVNDDGSAPRGKPKYYSAAQVEALQAEVTDARAAVDAAQRRAADAMAAYQEQYPAQLQFAYGTPKFEKPFLVRSIWHDGQFTYIKTEGHELPALYEVKDGNPALVNFQVRNGTYVVPKVIDQGYLALGKAQFPFRQHGR